MAAVSFILKYCWIKRLTAHCKLDCILLVTGVFCLYEQIKNLPGKVWKKN